MGVIEPPARIGMLGGGQLGRYALMAARTMGYATTVLDPDPAAPAGRVADTHLVAAYDTPEALEVMAATCAVVTTEFENPPAAALQRLATAVPVHPNPATVAIAQDRIVEKRFLHQHGVATAPFAVVESAADLAAAAGHVGGPGLLKTARLGYDGKGQRPVDGIDGIDELAAAWSALGEVPCVLERRVRLDQELSVLVARRASGAVAVYPVAENHHVDGILDLTVVPARVAPTLAAEASELSHDIATALDYVGLLAVELFVSDGHLLVNELAPRPHNSGHWTLDAATTSQFEQQVRAVCGLPLGDPALTAPAVAMVNLLGDRWHDGEPAWAAALADPGAHLHLYGKTAARPGRKMGHLTVTAATPAAAAAAAIAARDAARTQR